MLKGLQQEGELGRRLGVGFCDMENSCQRWSSKHDLSWQSHSPTSPLWGLPLLLPSWPRLCLFPHSDSKISPVGTQNLSCASCAEPTSTYMSPCPGTTFVHDCTDMELWKKIIWNHLKIATHCHFSYQKLFSIRMAMIQYLKSSNWAQKRNLSETSGFDSVFCKTWRDMQFFFFFQNRR